jgi:2-keto-4-pentenoate hydratase
MTIDPARIAGLDALAARLAAAWIARARIGGVADAERPANRAEAFAVQTRMLEAIGGAGSGWKVGATSVKMREIDGHDDIIPGRLLAASTFVGPVQRIEATRFPGARVEPEFAFRIERDLPARAAPYTAAEVAEAIVFLPAIEIIGDRYPRGPGAVKVDTLLTIADNGGGFGFVAGDPVADWRGIDFGYHHVSLRTGDGAESENFLGEMRAEPVEVVADLANMLGARGIGLTRGEFVTTGAAAVPQPLVAGSRVTADFGRLGRIELDVV